MVIQIAIWLDGFSNGGISDEKIESGDENSEKSSDTCAGSPTLEADSVLTTDESVLPKNLPLNDEVRLDNVLLSKNVNDDNLVLPNLAQKLFLTIVQEMMIAKPADELQNEELLTFIELVLAQKNTFCVKVVALLLRCQAESKNRRTIERALRQCEEVFGAFAKEQPEAFDRFNDVFGTGLPAMWKVCLSLLYMYIYQSTYSVFP